MRVTFDSGASDDLDRIFTWIAKDSPGAAQEMIARIEAKVMRLEMPALTPTWVAPGWSRVPAIARQVRRLSVPAAPLCQDPNLPQ